MKEFSANDLCINFGGGVFNYCLQFLGSVFEPQDSYRRYFPPRSEMPSVLLGIGEAFLLTVGAFLLTVKLLCLQSLKALIRRAFPL